LPLYSFSFVRERTPGLRLLFSPTGGAHHLQPWAKEIILGATCHNLLTDRDEEPSDQDATTKKSPQWAVGQY